MRKANYYEWNIAVNVVEEIDEISRKVAKLRRLVFSDTHPEEYIPKLAFGIIAREDFTEHDIQKTTDTLNRISQLITYSGNDNNEEDEDGVEIETYHMQGTPAGTLTT